MADWFPDWPLDLVLNEPPPPEDLLTILCVGDSITDGPPGYEGGWRTPFLRGLRKHGIQVRMLGSLQSGPEDIDRHHEGYGGYTTVQLRGLVGFWRRTFRPNIVLLLAGTNDLLAGPAANPPTQRAAAVENLTTLIDDLLAHPGDPLVIVAGIPPSNRTVAYSTIEVDVARFKVESRAGVLLRQAQGRRILWVDPCLTLDDILPDGVHPNELGYIKIGGAFLAAVVLALSAAACTSTEEIAMQMKLARFDEQLSGGAWDVGFDVTLDGGRRIYSVTTVYAEALPDTERQTIIAAARDELLPGLRLQNAPPAVVDGQANGLGEEIEIPPDAAPPHTHDEAKEHTH